MGQLPDADSDATSDATPRPERAEPEGNRRDERTPETWGPLVVLERVSSGVFGDVFRAHDPKLERDVALKLLRPRASARPGADSDAIEEGRLLAKVRNPHVATVYGADRFDGRVGIWMEFLNGSPLDEILAVQGPFGAREIAAIGEDLCRALTAVHGAGVIHRDVKAENVIREEGGRIVLADFGAGIDLEDDRGGASQVLSGTPLYMAPELFRGTPASARSDVYALGVLLFHLATVRFPVEGRTVGELRRAHAEGRRKSLRDARPDLPRPLARVIERAIDPEPSKRFATAGEMELALEDALAPGREAPAGRRLSLLVQLGPLRISIIASLMVLAGVALILPMYLTRRDSPPSHVGPPPPHQDLPHAGTPVKPGAPGRPSVPAAGGFRGTIVGADGAAVGPGFVAVFQLARAGTSTTVEAVTRADGSYQVAAVPEDRLKLLAVRGPDGEERRFVPSPSRQVSPVSPAWVIHLVD